MAAVMASDALAATKKTAIVVQEDPQKMKHTPSVQATTNQYCAVDREDLEVCFDFGVGVKLGWEFLQDYFDETSTPDVLDGYYTFELTFYSEQEVNLEFKLFV